jgi:hypothetical protein
MTKKEWGDTMIKSLIPVALSMMATILVLAFKAPFNFKNNVETAIEKKADKTEIERLDREKVGHTEFNEYKKTERELTDSRFERIDQKLDLILIKDGIKIPEKLKYKE